MSIKTGVLLKAYIFKSLLDFLNTASSWCYNLQVLFVFFTDLWEAFRTLHAAPYRILSLSAYLLPATLQSSTFMCYLHVPVWQALAKIVSSLENIILSDKNCSFQYVQKPEESSWLVLLHWTMWSVKSTPHRCQLMSWFCFVLYHKKH